MDQQYKADKTAASTSEKNACANYNVGASPTWVKREGTFTPDSDTYYVQVVPVYSSASGGGNFIGFDNITFREAANLANDSGTVLITSAGVTITNGALTVNNGAPGVGDVIIDGSSNMFKIRYSGTLSHRLGPLATIRSTSYTLTGLGSLSTTPAHVSYVSDTNTTTGYRHLGFMAHDVGANNVGAISNGRHHQRQFTGIRDAVARQHLSRW